MSGAGAPRPGTVGAWLAAARPRTLAAGVAPVAVGSAVAWRDGHFAPLAALAALVGALLIQVGTNLANDYFDFRRGADNRDRLGPPRATQQGWLAPRAVLMGSAVCFGLAVVVGTYLVAVAGWPLVALGLVSIAAGYAYTGGPYPLAYHGLGDVFVLVFFGGVAVCGTYYVQAQALSPLALAASLPVGALGVALLAVNNTRDRETDAAANKRTLVVRLGRGFGRGEYVAMLVVAAAFPVVAWATGLATGWALVALLAAPLAVPPVRLLFTVDGGALNAALAGTARLQLVYSLLLAAGLSR